MSFRSTLIKQPLPSRTENGMATFMSTNNYVLDLFSQIGGMRGKDVIPLFAQAFNENPELATKVALWARDARGGAGERQLFRNILKYLEKNDRGITRRIIRKVPELGRWDDLLTLEEQYAKDDAYYLIGRALFEQRNGLAAKWMPRQGEKAVELREYFGMSPKRWRKEVVGMSNTVEQLMCSKNWESINFDHVPSVAASRYQKAFRKNSKESYEEYVAGLKTGERKINASVVYPYDVLKSVRFGDERVALAQWDALENFVGDESWLPVIDTSPSMGGHSLGDNLTALDVAVSLGLYFADKNTGDFNGVVSEFSGNAKLHVLQGNILAKLQRLRSVPVDYSSTNLHAAFAEILRHAARYNIRPKDMPKGILIFSDMQFNSCVRFDDSAIEMIDREYARYGYKRPKVVFWNLAVRNTKQAPVMFDHRGVALVSGFSPAIFRTIASGKSFTPVDIMMETLNNERYDF